MDKNKQGKKKKGSFTTILLVAIFFVGLCVLLYPTISNYWNVRRQTQAIMNYDKIIEDLAPDDYQDYLDKADEYNRKLAKIQNPFIGYSKLDKLYNSTLNIDGNGMMGYITIEKIKVQLPIYHGTSAQVLNSAVGHVEGSSLPVGGNGTHSVLSAHRGLPSAKLFTNLDKLVEGDTFTITILNETITYQVYKITVALPKEISDLKINPNEDLCTLVTCTPYGINTHRLFVQGRRIDNIAPEKVIKVMTEAYQIDPIIVMPVVAVPMLGALLVFLLVKNHNNFLRKKRKKRIKKNN